MSDIEFPEWTDNQFREVDNAPSKARRFARFCGCSIYVPADAPARPSVEDATTVITCRLCAERNAIDAGKILELCRTDPAYRAWFFRDEPWRPPPESDPLDAVVLFLHYGDDAATRRHRELLQEHNPGIPIIPIHHGPAAPVPGSTDVGTDPQFACERAGPRDFWAFCDAMAYQWIRRNKGVARRVILIEADTLCTMPLREFYGPALWDAEAVASVAITPATYPQWMWWEPPYGDPLPRSLEPSRAGVGPMSAMLLRGEVLEAIAAHPKLPPRVFCELRLGTMLRMLGIPVSPLPPDRSGDVQCTPRELDTTRPSVYHPVK